ncbi:MAG: prepilin-type N-terminal cleavage/methylation domain-containing protein [Lentisphaerae bacterium]|jgi:general secretion pathway protein G|nr:prepilin-type N-terminal cleavage/methylation domain-containing protein [Lentisphaerota bacterium]
MNKTNQGGFTLVEVLTVVVIIGLLAALILGLATNAQKKAARSKAEAEIGQLESFLTDYQMQYGQLPGSGSAQDGNKLKDALADAKHSLSNFTDPWGREYKYKRTSKVTFYLWSEGDDPNKSANYIGKPEP